MSRLPHRGVYAAPFASMPSPSLSAGVVVTQAYREAGGAFSP